MKVAIHIDRNIVPEYGGGYAYVNRVIDALCTLQHQDGVEYCLLIEKPTRKDDEINGSFEQVLLHSDAFLRWEERIADYGFQSLKEERSLALSQEYGIDLIYYPHQHRCLTTRIPFIVTNWDILHITAPQFPELSGGHFSRREYWYREILPRALCVFVESETGKAELQRYLNVPEERVRIVPLFPGSVVELDVQPQRQTDILGDLDLRDELFFFYPAQFWAGKNHYTLIKAFKQFMADYHSDAVLVFTGADKGNELYIRDTVRQLDIEHAVRFLGFVEEESLYTLYKHAIALVMPTFLGPTNMPILEAMALGCPVLCSALEGHRELLGDAAAMFDPTDADQMAMLMGKVFKDSEYRMMLCEEGRKQYDRSGFNFSFAITCLHQHICDLKAVRKCWGT